MKPDQKNIPAAPVARNLQQVVNALESRLTSQIIGDIADANVFHRVDDDVPLVHPVAVSDDHLRADPEADCAADTTAANTGTEPFRKDHAGPVTSTAKACR